MNKMRICSSHPFHPGFFQNAHIQNNNNNSNNNTNCDHFLIFHAIVRFACFSSILRLCCCILFLFLLIKS